MKFREHTYERRHTMSSRWYIEEMVYGEIGPTKGCTAHEVNPHFRRINNKFPNALPDVLAIIQSKWNDIVTPQPVDFEDLYSRVYSLIIHIPGVKNIIIYDVALHIGCNIYPKILPGKYVYLSSPKVKGSAKILLPPGRYSNKVDKSLFGPMFKDFNSMDMEDLLCIFSKEIIASGGFDPTWLQTKDIKSHYSINP